MSQPPDAGAYERLENHAHSLFAVAHRQTDAINQAREILDRALDVLNAQKPRIDPHDLTHATLIEAVEILIEQARDALKAP